MANKIQTIQINVGNATFEKVDEAELEAIVPKDEADSVEEVETSQSEELEVPTPVEDSEESPVEDSEESPVEETVAEDTQGEEEESIEEDEPDEVVSLVMHTPSVSPEEIAEFEPDLLKRPLLLLYAKTLTTEQQLALYETLKASCGATRDVVDLIQAAKDLMEEAQLSKMYFLRNEAASKTLQSYNVLAQRVSRMINGISKDDPLNSLRIDDNLNHVKKLNLEIMTLSSAIYHMAGLLGIETPLRNEDMPIDIEALVKVCLTVGHAAKTWAATYSNSVKVISDLNASYKASEELVKSLRDQIDTNRELQEAKLRAEKAAMIQSDHSFYIMNRSGNYIGCMVEEVDGVVRLSPWNLYITQEPAEALAMETLDDARMVMDYMHEWFVSYAFCRNKFIDAGLEIKTLFIGRNSVLRVEGA